MLIDDGWTEEQIVLLTRYYVEKSLGAVELTREDVAQMIEKDPVLCTRKAKALGLSRLTGCLSLTEKEEKFRPEQARQIRESIEQRAGGLWRGECPVVLKALRPEVRPPGMRQRRVGGVVVAFRSSWEANYSRYLELLKQAGVIAEWAYEPETFWFLKIRQGTRSYLPDFRVKLMDGTVFYVEVKGYLDQQSKTRMRRMASYYPEVCVLMVTKLELAAIKQMHRHLIPDWETSQNRTRKC